MLSVFQQNEDLFLDLAVEFRADRLLLDGQLRPADLARESDDALGVETRPDAVKELLRQLKTQLEADVQSLEGLAPKG